MSDDKQYDFGLLQYNYSDDNKIVANSILEDTKPTLLNYLIRNNIPLVPSIPERWGIYCIQDEKRSVFKVYMVYFDKESGVYISEYQYSLQWINIVAKAIDDKPDNKTEEEIKKRLDDMQIDKIFIKL
jgi:hypothetical protein